jgi:predicted nucleic acid-binding protein
MIILDTNVISAVVAPTPDPDLRLWFARNGDELVTSAIVIAELTFGVEIMPSGHKKTLLEKSLRRMRQTVLRNTVLAFDEECAEIYANLAARLRQSGVAVGQSDMMIAATALQHGATVATRNTRHFEPCGVSVVNPFEAL